MVKKIENTEQKVIDAAREVFIKKGFDGARMQEIADEAGINKSLLHYYFRSKDKLFERVFTDAFSGVIATINNVFVISDTFESFIENFVVGYNSVLREKPFMPNFVLHEITRNPNRVMNHLSSANFDKEKIISLIVSQDAEKVRPFDPIQIIVNVISLSIFPFVARPLITGMMFDGDTEAFESFLDSRTQHIIEFVKQAVFIQK